MGTVRPGLGMANMNASPMKEMQKARNGLS